ncbi:MAG: hypothetical protein ABJE95_25475 [Byssovorax sp.]
MAAPPAPPEDAPRVIRVGKKLYVRHAPAGIDRHRLLYGLSADPLPGTNDHVKIGILRGVDRNGDSLEVAWYTLVDDDVESALDRGGLPIRLVQQDLEPRIGRHWGKYVPQPEAAFHEPDGDVVLELNLGNDDGAQPGDQYDVLGEARTDDVNRTVDSFAKLGTCTVRPFGAEATRSRCQIDRGIAALRFEKQHWMSGGYVKAITSRKGSGGAR